ncbi:Transglycosylase SLT domain-containing protein [Actinacidiphila yanglinensis]|uniref:Transglycosylase SLT domain-containing protein n=1 Tax=Actinacidiphila yanglinensis TaxID=310779 RepID=A0A1H5U523_9ACTN|nr:transglycosylase SLT domain-containing protein [Actinacidiphila yanglinensis]SEF70149.1 Transglycosylase SLT domain-containing protein [Actinacidiphila yanglinensis]
MQLPTIPKIGRLNRKHKITVAGVAAAAAVALTVTGLEATAGGSAVAAGDPTGFSVSTGDQVKSVGAKSGMASQKAISDQAAAQKKAVADVAAAKKKAAADAAAAKKKAADAAAAKKKAAADAAERAKEAANRSTKRVVIKHTTPVVKKAAPVIKKAVPVAQATTAPKKAVVTYPNNLDGWIREAQSDLASHGIPVPTYNGIYRNVIRESSGNPNAINLWDSNAAKGIPSKGLLQTIDPTFNAYHVSGTSWNVYNPVANIAAACNYAYHVYGGMDNVNSAY